MGDLSQQNNYCDTFCLDHHLHVSEPSPLINITIQMKTHEFFFLVDSKFAMPSAYLVRAQ